MIKYLLLFYLFFVVCDFASCSIIQVDLSAHSPFDNDRYVFKHFYKLTDKDNKLKLVNIAHDVGFLVVQIHSFEHNVTLRQIFNNTSLNITGTNIGLVYASGLNSAEYSLNTNVKGIKILIAVVLYAETAPVPGGCNLSFDNEVSPYQQISYTYNLIIADSQPPSGHATSCDDNEVVVDMYHMFLKENTKDEDDYFYGIVNMLTVDDIKKNGKLVKKGYKHSPYRRLFSAYWGTGEVFAIIAKHGHETSSYVSSVSYACDINRWKDDCIGLVSGFWHVYMPILLIAALYLCFAGHLSILITITIHESLVMVFIVFYSFSWIGEGFHQVAAIFGLIGIIGCIILQWFKPSWMVGEFYLVLLTYITSLFIFTSVIYFLDLEYNLIVLICVFSIGGIFLICFGKFMYLTCSMIGSFMLIIAIDFYIGNNANFYYAFLDFYRLMTVSEYLISIKTFTFQSPDITALVTWLIFLILGALSQHYTGKWQVKRSQCDGQTTEKTPLLFHSRSK